MEEFENFTRGFKGIWIPKEVWLDDRLNALDKIILMEIDSLDSSEEGCYATNEYITIFYQYNTRKVTESISKLIEFEYLYVYKFDGRKRHLKSRLSNCARQTSKNCEADWQNLLESNINNNIYNNNSSNNNNIYNNSNYNKSLNNNKNEVYNKSLDNKYNNNIYVYIEENFVRTLNPIEYEVVSRWEDNDLTRYAIKEAVLKGIYNIKYIDTVLSNYKKNSITTVQQAQEQEKKFKEKKNGNSERPMTASEKRQELYKRMEEKYGNDNTRN